MDIHPADTAIILLATGAGVLAAITAKGNPVIPEKPGPFWRPLIFLATITAAFAITALWLVTPHDPWNAARLTPIVALNGGTALYQPLDQGPVLSTVVGPVAFLFYSPVCTLLPSTPTPLILTASGLNLLSFAVLMLGLLAHFGASRREKVLVALVLVHLALYFASLRYSLFSIHADAPALILGAAGCGILILSDGPIGWARATTAATMLAGAVWAKQTSAPLYVAALVLALNRGGIGGLLLMVAACLGCGAVVSALLILLCGFEELWTNMLMVPLRHPWMQMSLTTGEIYKTVQALGTAAKIKVVIAECLHLVRANWPIFSALLAAFVLGLRVTPLRTLLRAKWVGFSLTALLLFPTAALGRTKVGGEINHESFVILFLIVAFVSWLLEAEFIKGARSIVVACLLAPLALCNAPRLVEYPGWQSAHENQNEAAYRYEKKYPGKMYFPWNPLTSVLNHGKVYHFDYGVFDRDIGGAEVSRRHILQGLPSHQPPIASYLAHHDYILRKHFPNYVLLKSDPDLPNWRIYGPPPDETDP